MHEIVIVVIVVIVVLLLMIIKLKFLSPESLSD